MRALLVLAGLSAAATDLHGQLAPTEGTPSLGRTNTVHTTTSTLRYTDVAYLPGADCYFIVWEELDFEAGVGRVVDASGAPLGPLSGFAPPNSGYGFRHQVAAIASSQRFVVSFGGAIFGGDDGWFSTVDLDGNTTGPERLLFASGAPDLAADGGLGEDVLAAYRQDDLLGDDDVAVARVSSASLEVVDTLTVETSASSLLDIDITPDGGADGRYLVTWREGPLGATEIRGAVIDRDLQLLVPSFQIAPANARNLGSADGDGTRWVVAYAVGGQGADQSIACRGVTYDPAAGTVRVTAERLVASDPTRREEDPFVAWLGESFVIAYEEAGSNLVREVHLTSLESFDCLECEGDFPVSTSVGISTEGVALATRKSAGSTPSEVLIAWAETSGDEVQSRTFTPRDGIVADLGGGCGTGGAADATCAYTGADAFAVRVSGATPNALAGLVLGTEAGNLSCGPCTLVPVPVELLIVPTDANGEAVAAFTVPPAVNIPGFEVLAQWLVAAPSGCSPGLSMSNALQVTFE